jgi:hypothetical protein
MILQESRPLIAYHTCSCVKCEWSDGIGQNSSEVKVELVAQL